MCIRDRDYEAQAAAYNALGDYEGAVIAIEPKTGKIAVMVSKPDYDPNTIASDWESVNGEGSTSLYNRATQGQYAPGLSLIHIWFRLSHQKRQNAMRAKWCRYLQRRWMTRRRAM